MKPDDLIPATPPAYGAETARVVLDIITQFPDNHEQSDWEQWALCGSARCVAGWAVHVHGEEVYFLSAEAKGRLFLALDREDACRLFRHTTNSQAIHALEYVAKGDRIDWAQVWQNPLSARLILVSSEG